MMFPKETWDLFVSETDTGGASGEEPFFTDANGVPWQDMRGYGVPMKNPSNLNIEDMWGLLAEAKGERFDVNDMRNKRFTVLPSLELAEKVLLVTGILQARESGDG